MYIDLQECLFIFCVLDIVHHLRTPMCRFRSETVLCIYAVPTFIIGILYTLEVLAYELH